MVTPGRFEKLQEVIAEIKQMKLKYGHVKNSDYYLDNILTYFKTGGIGNCQAGKKWLQATPDGYVQQCSELPRVAHYTDYNPAEVKTPACTKCWYTCRGESEGPRLSFSRLKDLVRA
jgi:MoaA/NifB/PqqE/SkfB family radical SAM enzyme